MIKLSSSIIVLIILSGGSLLVFIDYYSTSSRVDKLRGFLSYAGSSESNSYDQLSVIPNYTLPISMNVRWVNDLRREVEQLTGRQVTLLVCNKKYLDVLVNWLIYSILYASQPVESVLIIAIDFFSYSVLQRKGFHSVYISPAAVIKPSFNWLSRIWMTRLTIIRLLNYWNFNVLVIDSDAIMLKNIHPLLDKFNTSDIIASSASHPRKLSKKWNAPTMCMGFMLIKSSPATG